MTDSFQRYLRAKRTIDDRALDRRVIDRLRQELTARAETTDGPLRVLEVGAGIGTMIARAVEWDLLPSGEVKYTALDVATQNVATLPEYLRDWAEGRPVTVSGTDEITLDCPDRHITVEPVAAEAVDYAADSPATFDLLIGAALLDILELDGLDSLLGSLAPGGLFYFPITFDGATRFRPAHPADDAVEGYYHDHMDQKPGGSSRAGGDVLERLQATADSDLLAVAGSDWVVRPRDGDYPGDEAQFLRHILDTVESAVGEMAGAEFDDLEPWLATRREQVDSAELLYLTHQLDFLGRVDGG